MEEVSAEVLAEVLGEVSALIIMVGLVSMTSIMPIIKKIVKEVKALLDLLVKVWLHRINILVVECQVMIHTNFQVFLIKWLWEA